MDESENELVPTAIQYTPPNYKSQKVFGRAIMHLRMDMLIQNTEINCAFLSDMK